jgi:Mycothiol maleylpyruvate isomerase N-terminal domain
VLDMVYRDARSRVTDSAATLSDELLQAPVPATPRWTMHELLAHLVGGAADAASGPVDGAPGEQWTARRGSGEPATLLRTDGYELLRATFSRRSKRQIAAWNWTPAPAEQMIERIGFFGPRDDDQPVPIA